MNLSQIGQAIETTLAYADVFAYPLTAAEIQRYLVGLPASRQSVDRALAGRPDFCDELDGFYTLPGRGELVATRQRRAWQAARLWPLARLYGSRIARLPFVRMLAVTGALAVNNVEGGADIDYLVVTEPGHLWLTRALVLLLDRVSQRNHAARLCPNYLVTLRALVFPDQTLYTAHELAQMVPLAGMEVYTEIRRKNAWVETYLPNANQPPESWMVPGSPTAPSTEVPRSLARPGLEKLMRLAPFNRLETWEMERKISRLRRQQGPSPESVFTADICKGHDQGHQARTRLEFEHRLERLEPEISNRSSSF